MKHHPLPTDLGPTVDRLREIATQSTDALLTEGPVHPDHKLLDLCAEALHHRCCYDEANAVLTENAKRRSVDCRKQPGGFWTDADRAAHHMEYEQAELFDGTMRRVLGRARSFGQRRRPASTPRPSSSGRRGPGHRCWQCPWPTT